jgi:DNA-binding IclR family transcriptional regulator
LFVDVVESAHAVRYTAKVGKVVPMHAAATGRALLSQRPQAERAAFLRKAVFLRHTPNTLMSAEAVEQEIRRSLQRGWFVGHSEFSIGLGGVALALPMPGRHYAVLIAGPAERMADRYEKIARQARTIIEKSLGVKLPRAEPARNQAQSPARARSASPRLPTLPPPPLPTPSARARRGTPSTPR